jgi:hypothetical protein
MDFTLAVQIASLLEAGILTASTIEFGRSIYRIRKDVTDATFRALLFFGAASVTLGFIVINTTFLQGTIGQRTWIAFFLVFIILSEVHVATDSKKVHRGLYVIAVLALSAAALVAVQSPTEVSPILGNALTIAVIVAIILGAWLAYDSPSPFTLSNLLLLGAFLTSWALITQGTFGRQIDLRSVNLFLILFLPGLVASSIMASMLKPWRRIFTYFIIFTAVMTGASIGLGALISRAVAADLQIALFVFAASIIIVASAGSIDFFLEQSAETGARIPLYMAATLLATAGVLIVHLVFYPIVLLSGTMEDPVLSYAQWIVGLFGAGAFVVGGLHSIVGKNTIGYVRRGVLIFIAAMIVLLNPIVRVDTLGNYRWMSTDLVPYLLVVLGVGITGYLLVARRLRRVGSNRAARNFVAFAFSSLATAIVVFLAEYLSFIGVMAMVVVLGCAMLSTSPRIIPTDTR